MKAIAVFTGCSVVLASYFTCRASSGIPAQLRHRGRANTAPAHGVFSNERWATCPATTEKKEPKSLPGRKVAALDERDKDQLDQAMANLISATEEINRIMRLRLEKSDKNDPILVTAFLGCPDGVTGGSMVEILQELDGGETATAALPAFLKIDSIAGESDDGGGGGGSGGCYDEELGVCCEGPCPC